MRRLHGHVAVEDLAWSVRFHATPSAAEPSMTRPDHAKWLLDEPRANSAIGARGASRTGVEHLAIQVEDEAELAEVRERLGRAERPAVEEQAATCCHARSDKQWITDPQGVAWEAFPTHGEPPVSGRSGGAGRLANACCSASAAAP